MYSNWNSIPILQKSKQIIEDILPFDKKRYQKPNKKPLIAQGLGEYTAKFTSLRHYIHLFILRNMATKKKIVKKRWRPKEVPVVRTSSSGRGVTIDRFLCLEKLKPYFQLELDIKRSCDAYNTRAREEYITALSLGKARWDKPDFIARRTVQSWYEDDMAVRHQIDSWKDTTNIMARQAWRKEIQNGNFWASKDWLERREKEYFSVKTEVEQVWDIGQLQPWTSIRIEKANILFQLWTNPSQNNPSSPPISLK